MRNGKIRICWKAAGWHYQKLWKCSCWSFTVWTKTYSDCGCGKKESRKPNAADRSLMIFPSKKKTLLPFRQPLRLRIRKAVRCPLCLQRRMKTNTGTIWRNCLRIFPCHWYRIQIFFYLWKRNPKTINRKRHKKAEPQLCFLCGTVFRPFRRWRFLRV